MSRLPLLAALALAACRSSAPLTIPAAVINTGVAIGLAAEQRAAGGCYAVCTHGTLCNPKTGMCEKGAAAANAVCQEAPGGGMRCIPFEITAKRPPGVAEAAAVGVSPATGTVPPPPNESSPRAP